jgi:hypothetical protein
VREPPKSPVITNLTFGIIDGLNGAIGLIVSLLWAKAATGLIVAALLARAGSSSISMGGAEYETDADEETRRVRLERVLAMMAGYLISALVPGAGFLISRHVGTIWVFPTTAACLGAIIWARSRLHPLKSAVLLTLGIFGAAVGAGILASVIAPG